MKPNKQKLTEADSAVEMSRHFVEMADRIEELEAKLTQAVLALDEAIYLLDPDDEDIAKETGLHRIVTTIEELKGKK